MPDLSAPLNPNALQVGCVGWDYVQWLETYYPEDLPADWRLAYFANQCPLIVIPDRYWRCKNIELLADSLAGVRDDLHLYLEINQVITPGEYAQLSAWTQAAEGYLKGCLFRETGFRVPALAPWPAYVSHEIKTVAGMTLQIYPLQDAGSRCGSEVCGTLGRLEIADASQQRSLPALIRRMQTLAPAGVLFIDGSPPPINIIRQFSELLSLMDA